MEEQLWKPLDSAWVSAKAQISGDSDYTGFVGAHMAGLAPKPETGGKVETKRVPFTRFHDELCG